MRMGRRLVSPPQPIPVLPSLTLPFPAGPPAPGMHRLGPHTDTAATPRPESSCEDGTAWSGR